MGNYLGIVEGEWEDQPHNWKTFFKRWQRSKEKLRFEVIRTEAMSQEDFFVIGRAICGRVQVGDKVLVQVGDKPIASKIMSIDHSVQGDSDAHKGEFHMLIALKLTNINPNSGVIAGTIITHAS
ncbi:MAG: hypothetical protein F4138_04685 [Acidimicrobiia bacterium]|nr:hypothetical protein [Acidimicrobiia bacterium]MYC58517.1 hypothetical protein [Acidimicrobiia bacterium]MYG94275.1 hypothetical protein [Acidimicrobiia bacterium]MYI30377.1 hypothetical protein [Acidimicrobiia bacterium]